MTRDLVKEEAVARAVRWAEMLPADAEEALPGLSTAILHMRHYYDLAATLHGENDRLEEENDRLKDAIVDLEEELDMERASTP